MRELEDAYVGVQAGDETGFLMGALLELHGVRHLYLGGLATDWCVWSFFFFSSRRRHTRLQGDWSSDVCSSDLRPGAGEPVIAWDPARGSIDRAALERAGADTVIHLAGENVFGRWSPAKKHRIREDRKSVV